MGSAWDWKGWDPLTIEKKRREKKKEKRMIKRLKWFPPTVALILLTDAIGIQGEFLWRCRVGELVESNGRQHPSIRQPVSQHMLERFSRALLICWKVTTGNTIASDENSEGETTRKEKQRSPSMTFVCRSRSFASFRWLLRTASYIGNVASLILRSLFYCTVHTWNSGHFEQFFSMCLPEYLILD